MRISHRWLVELVPDLRVSGRELAERLTRAGLEVEALREIGAGLEPVVIAAVRKLEPHPTRSGLTLVTVDRGQGHEQRVVCGAGNVPAPGGLVVLAPLGTSLPAAGITLTAREIAGVVSEGMLCSEKELGLAEESSGILVLPERAGEPGAPLLEALPEARDTVLEIGVTPNRPDALGHIGVARDAAALFGLVFAPPPPARPLRIAELRLEDLVQIENLDQERCPHYGASIVVDVRVQRSPLWLRWRLASLGVRPISNVVDVTNLLLLGWGHPMHAFDLDRVREGKIVVRRARAAEPFTTLDGVARKLDADDLVICDGQGPSALAGVMGGAESEITDGTRRVLLECAYFSPRGIRRTSRRHALHTESSFRFERGVDWGAIPTVLDHGTRLLSELASGAAVPGAIHARGARPVLPTIRLRSSRVDRLLGVTVPFDEARASLERLGFPLREIPADGDRVLEAGGVSWRPDVAREVDLIEEVARVRGLDEIPTVLPRVAPQPPRTSGRIERDAAREAVSLGLSEAVAYAFVSPRELELVKAPPAGVTLQNPLTEERSVMRTSLLPGLLEALGRARRHGERAVRLFCVGACFFDPVTRADRARAVPRPRLDEDVGVLPEERPMFAAVIAGPRPTHLSKPDDVDVYDAKGVATEIVERLTGRKAESRHAPGSPRTAHLHPRGAAELLVDGLCVAAFGPLHPEVVDSLDLQGAAQIVEIDLGAVEALGRATPSYRPIPRLPPVTRDIALLVSDRIAARDVERLIRETAGELCESVELFDLFRGAGIPEGHRSLAFHLIYRDPKAASEPERARTLTDREVDEQHARVIRAATEQLGGQLRG
jgi:phenylalanyl-tRNA synthetase beta chain